MDAPKGTFSAIVIDRHRDATTRPLKLLRDRRSIVLNRQSRSLVLPCSACLCRVLLRSILRLSFAASLSSCAKRSSRTVVIALLSTRSLLQILSATIGEKTRRLCVRIALFPCASLPLSSPRTTHALLYCRALSPGIDSSPRSLTLPPSLSSLQHTQVTFASAKRAALWWSRAKTGGAK